MKIIFKLLLLPIILIVGLGLVLYCNVSDAFNFIFRRENMDSNRYI